MPDLASLVALLQLAVKERTQLALENIALRHELAVYKRSVGRPGKTGRQSSTNRLEPLRPRASSGAVTGK